MELSGLIGVSESARTDTQEVPITERQVIWLMEEALGYYSGFLPKWLLDQPFSDGRTFWDVYCNHQAFIPDHIEINKGLMQQEYTMHATNYYSAMNRPEIMRCIYRGVDGIYIGKDMRGMSQEEGARLINDAWYRSVYDFFTNNQSLLQPDRAYALYDNNYRGFYIAKEDIPGELFTCDFVIVVDTTNSIVQLIPITRERSDGSELSNLSSYYKEMLYGSGVITNQNIRAIIGDLVHKRPEHYEFFRIKNIFNLGSVTSSYADDTKERQRVLAPQNIEQGIVDAHREWLWSDERQLGYSVALDDITIHWLPEGYTGNRPFLPRRLIVERSDSSELQIVSIPNDMFPILEDMYNHGPLYTSQNVHNAVTVSQEVRTYHIADIKKGFARMKRALKKANVPSIVLYFHKNIPDYPNGYYFATADNKSAFDKYHTAQGVGHQKYRPRPRRSSEQEKTGTFIRKTWSIRDLLNLATDHNLPLLPQETQFINDSKRFDDASRDILLNRLRLALHWTKVCLLVTDEEGIYGSHILYYRDIRPGSPTHNLEADVYLTHMNESGIFNREQYVRLLRQYGSQNNISKKTLIKMLQEISYILVQHYVDTKNNALEERGSPSRLEYDEATLLSKILQRTAAYQNTISLWLPIHTLLGDFIKEYQLLR